MSDKLKDSIAELVKLGIIEGNKSIETLVEQNNIIINQNSLILDVLQKIDTRLVNISANTFKGVWTMINKGGRTTSVKTMAWGLNYLKALPTLILLPKSNMGINYFRIPPSRLYYKIPMLHLLIAFGLIICKPLPCFSDVCLPAETCDTLKQHNGVGVHVRDRLDSIKITHTILPTNADLNFNKTRSNIRKWLTTWTL